ncbi:MAG: hypothetical protein EPN93_17435 [Spirochaetes bacterium]|nr:MAG: hypothetical protein EPN93_17435 [Spirochaetota bacterium]
MDERLRKRFEELRSQGLVIDEHRGVASLTLHSRMRFAEKGVGAEGTDATLSLDEDEKYLYAPFRALTATVIRDRAIDFSDAAMLKKSAKMLLGQTVYANHTQDVTAWLGVVAKTWWDDGGTIPPGVNATLKISKEWNLKIVAGIKEEAIHSASVEVYFEWKKSHPDLEDFWFHFGEEIDGKLVCVIATAIISYGEISLVWQGADIYAKRLSLQAATGGRDGVSASGKAKGTEDITGGASYMKLTRQAVLLFGLMPSIYGFAGSAQEIELDEAMQAKFIDDAKKKYAELSETSAAQRALLTTLFGETPADTTAAENLKSRAAMGDAHLAEVREDALKFAKLAEGSEKLTEALGKTIAGASLEDAVKFRDEYRAKAEEKFPPRCTKCGEKFSRASGHKITAPAEREIDPDDYIL